MDHVFDIALVFSPHEWVEALHRHCTNTGELRIRSLIYDPSVLQSETFDACVISDSHPALSAGLVQSLHDSGHLVLGVCDDEQARSFLASINIDGVFSSRLPADELTMHIGNFLESTWDSHDDHLNKEIFEEHKETSVSHGLSFGVVGSGGVGTTEIALILASRLTDSVVIDVDFEHPSIAPRAGLDVNPHILDALESAHNHIDNFADQSQRLPKSAAIVGVSHSSFAQDIREYETESLCSVATQTFTHTIFDLGRLSEDSAFHLISRAIIATCDAIVLVGEPTPVGALRILENIAAIQNSTSDKPAPKLTVVFNKCMKNRSLHNDVRNEICDIEQVSHCTFLPYSHQLIESSWRSEVKQPSSWKKPINELIGFLTDIRNATILTYPTDKADNFESGISERSEVPA